MLLSAVMTMWPFNPHALRDRVAVVAGATRGAGRGIAAALAFPLVTSRTFDRD
jgi:hypothetical protein